MNQSIEVEGALGRTVYQAEGYAVVWFHPSDGSKATRVVFKQVSCPASYSQVKIRASVRKHERYGEQLFVESVEPFVPSVGKGLVRYLHENLEGVGPKTAQAIVDAFGDETGDALASPERLSAVIKPALAEQVAEQWKKLAKRSDLFAFLHQHGFGPKLCERVAESYGDKALDIAKTNPYAFLRVDGVGFLTADRMAMSMGYDPAAEKRLTACIDHVLSDVQGDVCMEPGELVWQVSKLLENGSPSPEMTTAIRAAVDKMLALNRLATYEVEGFGPEESGVSIYHPGVAKTEATLAERLASIRRARIPRLDASQVSSLLGTYQSTANIKLAAEQVSGILALHESPLVVVTGGPGTGKTTLLRAACDAYEKMGLTILLASPTGRAAKRMTELTGRPASTIHRLLEFSPESGDFLRTTHNPIGREHSEECFKNKYKGCECEFYVPPLLLVVDESSMLDMDLALSLIQAVYYGSRVLLVGDVDQLPSVGAGAVLRDIIDSRVCPVVRLRHIFRQDGASAIPASSAMIMDGVAPSSKGDFFVASPAEVTTDYVVELVRRTAARLSLAVSDVQVLVPMKKGVAGMNALNAALQAAFNPATQGMEQMSLGGYALRKGDKVIQLRNDYQKDVFNGEMGTVWSVQNDPYCLTVDFDGKRVSYENRDELDMLQLAYAMTIHKAQGSEYPAVVALALPEHWHMLNRNLLYTAVTRAKKLCVVVTDKAQRGLTRSCEATAAGRRTNLCPRIVKEMGLDDEVTT